MAQLASDQRSSAVRAFAGWVWRKPDGLLWQDPLPAKARTNLRFGQYTVISTPIEYEDDHCVYYERINDVIYVDYLGLTNRK